MNTSNYQMIAFKLEGHNLWRVTNFNDFKNTIVKSGQVTHAKMIEVDRVSGEIKLYKLDERPS